MSRTRLFSPPLLLTAVLLVTVAPALAGTISMRWDPVDDQDLQGYRIYYDDVPDRFSRQVDVGPSTTHTVTDLADCTEWYLAVKAYDTAGNESLNFSNEVTGWPRPVVASSDPASGRPGETLSLTLSGTNFRDGATVEFTHPDITVQTVTVNSCNEIVVDISIATGAATGSVDIDVVNPSRAFGTGIGAFRVSDGNRAEDGLVALYDFEEGAGTMVHDVSGVGAPLDLTIRDAAAVSWIGGGLSIDASTLIESGVPASKLIDASKASHELSVEAWLKPANLSQAGPARIVTLSDGSLLRNFTVAQDASQYDIRSRSTGKDDNGMPNLPVPSAAALTLSHLVFTRDAAGNERVYVDGVERATQSWAGDLSNWSDAFHLGLANELNADRAWLGELHLVAIFERALTAAQVQQNFAAGPDGNQPPTASFTADPSSGTAPLTVAFDASGSSDPDGSIVSYDWDFGDGSTGSGVAPSHEYAAPGTYTAVLSVTDDDGALDTSSETIRVDEVPVPPTIVEHPVDQTVNVGQAATFSCRASGTEPLSYQWQRDGQDIPGANSTSYTTPPTTLEDDGSTYRCAVANAAGSDVSNPATLTVIDGGGPNISQVRVNDVTATTATVVWATDEPADSLVRYRKQGASVYQETDLDLMLVLDHSVPLQGLSPNTTYEYEVVSADALGNSSSSSQRTFVTGDSPYDYLSFESEAGVLVEPVRERSGAGSFGDRYIETDPASVRGTSGNPAGSGTYGFHVDHTGPWYLWFRVQGADAASDSWFESVDGAPRAEIAATRYGEWQWVRGRSYSLQPGLHNLELGGKDPGARADRMLLTDDPSFVPTEEPTGDVTPPDVVAKFKALPGDKRNDLSWTNPLDGDYRRTVVRYRTDGRHPQSPVDGLPAADRSSSPGVADGHSHSGLVNGTTYYYSAFAVDAAGNPSEPSLAVGTPAAKLPPGLVKNLRRKDKGKGQNK